MQLIKNNININFIGKRKIAFGFSLILILISLFSLIIQGGPKYGVDFAGGAQLLVKFKSNVDLLDIKSGLDKLKMSKASVQQFGSQKDNEYKILIDDSNLNTSGLTNAATEDKEFSTKIQNALTKSTGIAATVRSYEVVGPKVGKDLREKALFAMFYALLFIIIYISWRFELKLLLSGGMSMALIGVIYVLSLFNVSVPILMIGALVATLVLTWAFKLKYALGAIVALIHDVIITLGVFSIFQKEIDLPIIAALLTIIGYSLNDTIIVFDRIRENLRKHNKKPLDFVVNRSINETLSRTLLTSGTTLVVLLCLFVLGGGIIHNFAFAMLVGVLTGTYSSIYVASPVLLLLRGK